MKFQVSSFVRYGIIAVLALILVGGVAYFGYPAYASAQKERALIQRIQRNKDAVTEYAAVVKREEEIKKDLKNGELYLSLGNHWDAIADVLNDRLAREHAIHSYERGIAVVGTNGDLLYLNAGNDYRSLGLYTDAEKKYKQAMQVNPADATGYQDLIELYRVNMKKGPTDIMPIYQQGLDKLVENAYLVQSLAEYYVFLGQPEKSLQYYQLLAKKYPGQFDPIVAKITQQIATSSTKK